MLNVCALCVAYVKFDSVVIGISFPFIKCDHRHPKELQNFIGQLASLLELACASAVIML